MAVEMVGGSYVKNGEILPENTFEKNYKDCHPSVYEVIRVIDGKPLFMEEHHTRMVLSARTVECELTMTREELTKAICDLSALCGLPNQNVRVVINNFRAEGYDSYVFFVPTHYPTQEQYAQGVPADLMQAVRNNPHAKIVNQSLRDQADRAIREKQLFEVILVDEAGRITEGSRSNIFFVRDGELYTSPSDGVLLGVTRTRILKVCAEHGLAVHEVNIPAAEVGSFRAAFISGTSPNILPISRIGAIPMDVKDPCLRRLMELFAEEIRKDRE